MSRIHKQAARRMLQEINAQTVAALRSSPWVEGDENMLRATIADLERAAWGGNGDDDGGEHGFVNNLARDED